ncbi:hypothetical protein ACFY2R_23525 [Micromonospora olivasterospora]|uniref:hypothetical protein n=1 Tax=Micromonospora olivasterospora TaxID=1880 RepID=UPI00119FA509|nr:hypothetical protein [Micromonospora olivasterospora]
MGSYIFLTPRLGRRLATGFVSAALLGLTACGGSPGGPAASPGTARTGTVDLSAQAQLQPSFPADELLRALLPQSVRDSGVVRTATSVGLPPVNFPGASSTEVKGLNADLIRAVEQLLAVRFQSENYASTASQLLALDSRRIDLTTSTNGDTRASGEVRLRRHPAVPQRADGQGGQSGRPEGGGGRLRPEVR